MKTIKIFCQKCNSLLYKYHKNKHGNLVKCYKDMIARDFTKGDLKCEKCKTQFAREAVIHNRPANKIIRGKVFVRR